MDSLLELCDLIAQNPAKLSDKLAWICNRCPSLEFLLTESPRVSRSQLNAILGVARFLSKCPDHADETPKSLLLEFYRSTPSSFNTSFWPQSFPKDSICSFFNDFLNCISRAAESTGFAADVAEFTGEIVIYTINNSDSEISRIFLNSLCLNFPPILPSDANNLVSTLFDRFEISVTPCSPKEVLSVTPDTTSAQSSPISVNHYQSPGNEASIASAGSSGSVNSRDEASSSRGIVVNGGSSIAWKSNMDILNGTVASNDASVYKKTLALFEEESIKSLEKQEIAFKLIGHVLDKAAIDPKLLEHVRSVAKDQLQSILTFLKIRKSDWAGQGQLLKLRINTKLSVYQAAARLQVKALPSLDAEGKTSKRVLHGALALLIEASEACLFSAWRKLGPCEELFSSLLGGISQAAVTRGGQLLRILLIRFKPLVLATCAQADTWANSPGVMFESVLKTCCEIICFGWMKDRSPIDTFIMGLATSVRERNDFEDEKGKIPYSSPQRLICKKLRVG